MSKLLIVGTLAFDAIETPFGKVEQTLGGAANYIGVAASLFGVESAIVSIVGEDYPQQALHLLQSRNIDISQVETIKGGKTFFWSGKYHSDLNTRDTMETQLNVLEQFTPVIPQTFKKADVVMLGNLHPITQLNILQQMEEKPKLVVLDTMNYWIKHTPEDLLRIIPEIDVITLNEDEARELTNEYSLVRAADKIRKLGAKHVIIKKGEHGALLFHKKQVFFAPALPLEEVFDPTGAGDVFAGGFAGYLSKTGDYSFENMKTAIIHACNLASFCVEKFGMERMLNLTQNDISKRLILFKELTKFDIQLV